MRAAVTWPPHWEERPVSGAFHSAVERDELGLIPAFAQSRDLIRVRVEATSPRNGLGSGIYLPDPAHYIRRYGECSSMNGNISPSFRVVRADLSSDDRVIG